MKRRTLLTAVMAAGATLAFQTQAVPPEGKGQGHSGKSHDNSNAGKQSHKGHSKQSQSKHSTTAYDSHGRNRAYFDDHRDSRGRLRDGDAYVGLIYAGITAATARRYAMGDGLRGYSSLPPGIRKNLARGKPLPPGIAKKMTPGPLLGQLPRHDGYEWRVAGTDLVLIATGTAVVADVLYDVFD